MKTFHIVRRSLVPAAAACAATLLSAPAHASPAYAPTAPTEARADTLPAGLASVILVRHPELASGAEAGTRLVVVQPVDGDVSDSFYADEGLDERAPEPSAIARMAVFTGESVTAAGLPDGLSVVHLRTGDAATVQAVKESTGTPHGEAAAAFARRVAETVATRHPEVIAGPVPSEPLVVLESGDGEVVGSFVGRAGLAGIDRDDVENVLVVGGSSIDSLPDGLTVIWVRLAAGAPVPAT